MDITARTVTKTLIKSRQNLNQLVKARIATLITYNTRSLACEKVLYRSSSNGQSFNLIWIIKSQEIFFLKYLLSVSQGR